MNAGPTEETFNAISVLLALGKVTEALSACEDLVRQFPDNAFVWFKYGSALGLAGRIDDLHSAWQKAVELAPDKSELLLQIGHAYSSMRLPAKAWASYERSAALDPRGINPRMALAICLERNHRFAEAREIIASCLAIDPRDEQARYFQAFLDRRLNNLEAAEQVLRDLIASGPRHPYVVYACRYELAQVLNYTERFDEAMKTLADAKKLVCQLADVNSLLSLYDQQSARIRSSTEAMSGNVLRTWAKETPEECLEAIPRLALLGGHPRSGTTLLEQIIGAHPEVAAFDEPRAFLDIADSVSRGLLQLTPEQMNVTRRYYIKEIEKELNGDAKDKLILDKNPALTAWLSIWLRAFPESRIIIALRDPRDVVISCYFQNIPLNQTNANFLSLERIATHYANMMDVWLAVREWDGLAWIETRYEDTVANMAQEGRRVTEFLRLTWHEAQARFHEKSSKKQIYSLTYHDASQPVYTRSVSRWRAFEKHLAPIQPLLERYCRAFGYS